jgi:hypothetical protein
MLGEEERRSNGNEREEEIFDSNSFFRLAVSDTTTLLITSRPYTRATHTWSHSFNLTHPPLAPLLFSFDSLGGAALV